ncbi:hypothetical protein HRbin36_02304 [bacterium HR36]|nr:hypothetical protein HRbin36_02304 [bacterium HR36]
MRARSRLRVLAFVLVSLGLGVAAGCGDGRQTPPVPMVSLQPLAEDQPLHLRVRGSDERGRRVNEVFINGRWVSVLNDPLFDQWLAFQVARYEAFYQQTGTPKMQIPDRNGCRLVFRTQVILEVVGDGHAGGVIHAITRRLREAGFASPPQIITSTGAVQVGPNAPSESRFVQ